MRIKEILSKLSLKKGPASFAAATLASMEEYDLDRRTNQIYLLRSIEAISTGSSVEGQESFSSNKNLDKTKELVKKLKILFKQMRIEKGNEYSERFFSLYCKKLKDYIDSDVTSRNNVHHPLYDEFQRNIKSWFTQGLENDFMELPVLLAPLEEPKQDDLQNLNSNVTASKMIDFHLEEDFAKNFLAYLMLYQVRRQGLSFDRAKNNIFGWIIEECNNRDQKVCVNLQGSSTANELKMLVEDIQQNHYKNDLDVNIEDLKRIFSVLTWTLCNSADNQHGIDCLASILYQVGKNCIDLRHHGFDVEFGCYIACSKYGFPIDEVFFANKKLAKGYEDLVFLYEQYPFEYVVEILTQITFSRFSAINVRPRLEQFIYEEYNYGIVTTQFSPSIQSEINKYSELISAIPDRENVVSIDDANGPQQTLNRLTAPISLCNGKIGSIVRVSVFLRLLEKYCQYSDSNWSYLAIDSDAQKVRSTIVNNDVLKRLCSGEGGEDSYSGYSSPDDVIRQAKSVIDLQVGLENVTRKLGKIGDSFEKLDSDFECVKSENERLKVENRRLLKERSEIAELSELALEENSKLVEQQNDFAIEKEDLVLQIHELQLFSEELKNSLHDKEVENARQQKYLAATYNERRDELCSVDSFVSSIIEAKNLYPADCLSLLSYLAKDKVVVLPEAMESARELDQKYTQTGRMFSLLLKLIYKYAPQYFEKGDTAAKQVFTAKEYAAQDSETTQNTKQKSVRSVRSVSYRGRNYDMRQHLKIGVANNVALCLRIYFFMDPDMKCPVIGYCGSHPDK